MIVIPIHFAIKNEVNLILVSVLICNLVAVLICLMLTKFRLFFAEMFMISSILVRMIGFYLLARRLPQLNCNLTLQMNAIRFVPIYLVHADIIMFRTNIFTMFAGISIFLIISGFVN